MHIFFNDEITTESTKTLLQELYEAKLTDCKFIYLFMNTNGGLIADAYLIANYIKSLGNVIVIAGGDVDSAGLYILSAGYKKYAYKHTLFLFHNATCGKNAISNTDDLHFIQIGIDRDNKIKKEYLNLLYNTIDINSKYEILINTKEAIDYQLIDGLAEELNIWN